MQRIQARKVMKREKLTIIKGVKVIMTIVLTVKMERNANQNGTVLDVLTFINCLKGGKIKLVVCAKTLQKMWLQVW